MIIIGCRGSLKPPEVCFSEAGISRSVTMATAYVMKKFQWSSEKALLFIQVRRVGLCNGQSDLIKMLAIQKNRPVAS